MTIASRDIAIPTSDGGVMPAYIAMPASGPAPAIVLVTHVFGNDLATRTWADRFAANGFITISPDVFWRTIPGAMDPNVPDQRAKATERNEKFDVELGQRDIASARDYVLKLPESNGTWACAGYCFGGRYTVLAAANLGADAVVAFHPSKMQLELETAKSVTCPVSYHFGGADASVPMEVVDAVKAALANNPRAESFVYPGVAHGFTSPARPAYDKDAAETSFERAIALLNTLKTA